jgi:DNA-binding transcriptional LysR family regulator
MYDLNRVRVLQAVAERGSFSAAADALDYTQSAVSKQVAALERETGLALIDRGVRPCRTTDAGRALLDHARAAVGHLAAAEAEIAAIAGVRSGTLRLGAFGSAGPMVLVPAVAEFHRRHPGVALSLIEADPPEAIALVGAGELDLAVVYDYAQGTTELDGQLEVTNLMEDEFELVVPTAHPLARRRRVSLADLAEERWLFPRSIGGVSSTYNRLMRGACAVAGFEPDILFEINDCQTAQGFVAQGMGVAVLPRLAIHPRHAGVTVRRLAEAPSRRVSAIRLKASDLSPATRSGLECIRRAARDATRANPRTRGA